MEDLIINEVRRIKEELEKENKNDFTIIFNKHKTLHPNYISRIVEKDDLVRKEEVYIKK
jgi:hypothetical protein